MKHINKLTNKIYIILILGISNFTLNAQRPVQVIPQLISPVSAKLSDYYTSTIPKLYLTLTNRDLLQPQIKVKLKISINSNTIQIASAENIVTTAITLDAGIPYVFSQTELEPYFNIANLNFTGITKEAYQKAGKLPEGLYYFCFEVRDYATNEVLSNNECATAWLSLNDPPLLNIPTKNQTVNFNNPQFISFNWTPRHLNSPNGAFNYEYEFQMVEILDKNVDPNAAFLSSPIFYSTSLTTTTLIYGVEKPQLNAGRRYAWRVKVKPADLNDDYDEFKNGGYSEIFWFDYEYDCPQNLELETVVLGNGRDLSVRIPYIQGKSECNLIVKDINTGSIVKDTVVPTSKTILINDLPRGFDYYVYFHYLCNGPRIVSKLNTVNIKASNFGNLSSRCNDEVNLRGKVLWAFSKDENKPSSALIEKDLVKDETIQLNSTSLIETKPLKDAIIEVYYLKNGAAHYVARAISDAEGLYNFNIVPDCRTDTFIFEYKHPNGVFMGKRVVPEFSSGSQSSFATYREVVLEAKSFAFEPKIVTRGLTEQEKNKLQVEILLDNVSYDILYKHLENQQENFGSRLYNGYSYHIVAKVNATNPLCNLFQNVNNSRLYIAVANFGSNTPDVDYVLPATNDFVKIKRWFNYTISKRIRGKVTKGLVNSPILAGNARVKITIKREWLLDANNFQNQAPEIQYQTTTNSDGEYSFDIPRLVDGTQIIVTAIDREFSVEPDYVITNFYHSNNNDIPTIFLKYRYYTVIGRLMVFESTLGFPVEGARVSVSGNNGSTFTTNKEGFFFLGSNWDSTKNVTFTRDGYNDLVVPLYHFERKLIDPNSTQPVIDGANLIRKSRMILDSNFTNRPLPVDASLFFPGNTLPLEWVYTFLKALNPDLLGIIDAGVVKLPKSYINNNNVFFKFLLNGKLVSGDLKITTTKQSMSWGFNWGNNNNNTAVNSYENFTTQTGKVFEYRLNSPSYYYTYSYSYEFQYNSADMFKPISASFTLPYFNYPGSPPTFIEVNLDPLITHTITIVTQSTPPAPIYSCQASIQQNIYTADNNGKITLILDPTITNEVLISKSGYTAKTIYLKDPGNSVISLSQLPLNISKISGFSVNLTKQDPARNPNEWLISGELTIPNNAVYSVNNQNNKLHFENIEVKTTDLSGNSYPLSDINFNEIALNATLFNYVPVEIRDIKLSKPISANDYSTAVIVADHIYAKLGVVSNNAGIPVQLPDAEIFETANNSTGLVRYAFITPGTNINLFRQDKSYNLSFLQNTGNPDFLAVSILPNVFINIHKRECSIQSDGINLPGFFQFPSTISSQADNNGRLNISTFRIRADLRSYDLSFDLSNSRPFFVKLQKVQAKITNIMLTGLGSPNCGVGFGGEVWLVDKPRESTNRDGVVTIHELSIINSTQGVTLTGRFSVPQEGVAIKNLVFKTPGGSYIGFSFNFSDRNFSLDASGRLEFNGTANSALNKVFPIDIQTFRLRTRDFGLLLIARPNIQVELGPIKIIINTFLVNIGYNASMDAMATMMNDANVNIVPETGGPDDLVQESRVSWVIGIGGEIEFPIRGVTIGAGGKVIVGNINNSIDFRVTQISLRMENPAFTLAASVGLSLSGQRRGFEGAAELTILGNGLAASFRFYQLYDANDNKVGIELGASINFSSSTGIQTGPITWLSIGGGFDFNTRDQRYEVWLSGDVTATGTPREAMYVSIARIGIVFDVRNCGAAPVLDGTGRLFIRNEEWLSISVRTDFCRMLFFLELRGSIPLIPGLPRIEVRAIIFAMAPYQGRTGCLFFYASASISSNIINGNITLALGYNYDNTHQYAPQEIKAIWHTIDARAKDNNGTVLNAIAISASIDIPRQNGDFGVSIGSWDLFRFYYDFYANASAFFMYKFSTNTLLLRIIANAEVRAGLTLFGASLHGYAYAHIDITGGYDGVWYCYGDISAGIQLWNGDASCNSSRIEWYESCVPIYYPCCWRIWSSDCWCFSHNSCTSLPGPIRFKVCLEINLNWYVRQGESTRVRIGRK